MNRKEVAERFSEEVLKVPNNKIVLIIFSKYPGSQFIKPDTASPRLVGSNECIAP